MVWYSHLFQKFPQFIVINTVEGSGVVNKAEIDVFLELSCFFDDPVDIGNLISSSYRQIKTPRQGNISSLSRKTYGPKSTGVIPLTLLFSLHPLVAWLQRQTKLHKCRGEPKGIPFYPEDLKEGALEAKKERRDCEKGSQESDLIKLCMKFWAHPWAVHAWIWPEIAHLKLNPLSKFQKGH